jgi:hypothetical protein
MYNAGAAPTMTLRDYATLVVGDGGGGEAAAEKVAPPYIFAESKPKGSKSLVDIFPEVLSEGGLQNVFFFLVSLSNRGESLRKALRASSPSVGWARCRRG